MIAEHPSGPSAGVRIWCRTAEHPSICNAARVTNFSPRGEMGQVRSALGPEGCSMIPCRSKMPHRLSHGSSISILIWA